MTPGKGLGKGLGAIFGDEIQENKPVRGLRISEIEPQQGQPRQLFDAEKLDMLAESIRQHGVITPITVRKTGNTYQIIAGERRWRAARMAGLSEIPAIVLNADEQRAFELALVENLQRENLDPIEEAEGYRTLIERLGLTQAEASEKVGVSRPAIANSMRLLNLPEQVRKMVRSGELSAGHARTLLSLSDERIMTDAAKKVASEKLSVRQTETLVKHLSKQPKENKKPDMEAFYVRQLEKEMSTDTGHLITIKHGKRKGKITVEYYGNDDLERICQILRTIK